jgi:hypothetical protein
MKTNGYILKEQIKVLIQNQKLLDNAVLKSFYSFDKPSAEKIDKAINDYFANAARLDNLINLRAHYNDTIIVYQNMNISSVLRQCERISRIINVLQSYMPESKKEYGSETIIPESISKEVITQVRNDTAENTFKRIKEYQEILSQMKIAIAAANSTEIDVPERYSK